MTADRPDTTLETLLEFVKESRGFDFTGYKRSTIERRVAKRMATVAVERYDDYLDYLELHGEEFAELFNTLLINTTGFFRDPQTWEYLATDIAPQLLAARADDSPIRVWCAGCASGEEPYTVAMVLARVMGDVPFRERVKIYATDVDEEALDLARHGAYVPRQIEDVPPDALERFFERTDQRYVFRKDLRRSVIFGRNDLVQDAPISRIDLLVCRNTLMYFTAETQSQILRRFHFALDDDGYMLLGKSEMLITHTDLFAPVELKRRVFRKVIKPPPRSGAGHGRQRCSRPGFARDREPTRGSVRHRWAGAHRARSQPRADHGQRRGTPAVRPEPQRLRPPRAGPRALVPPSGAAQPPRLGRPRHAPG